MTSLHDARVYAGRLWGAERIARLGLRADGGVDVELTPLRTPAEDNGLAMDPRTYSIHRLDAQGHPICHTACQALDRTRPAACEICGEPAGAGGALCPACQESR